MKTNISYEIISAEKKEIWPLEEVKNYLRVSHKDDDQLIKNFIDSATDYAEKFLGMNFFTKTIRATIYSSPNVCKLKYIPVLTIDNVSLIQDEKNEDIKEDFGHLDADGERLWIVQKYWHKKITIQYQAGWGQNIPRSIIHGIIMHVGAMYDFGENINNISAEIKNMYLPYRRFKV